MKAIVPIGGLAAMLMIAAVGFAQDSKPAEIITAGHHLAKVLDKMDVEHRWLSETPVKWRTGEPLERKVEDGKHHTHCSAFVAAAAAELGIYVLRPPQHSSTMLADAQYDWLQGDGRKEGWQPVATALAAQQRANRGELVIAVYKERDPKKPGHAAIVRPSTKSEAKIREEGPQIIQAGMENHASTSLKDGFKHHPAAFRDNLIRFYSHAVPKEPESEEKSKAKKQ
jgi:hypothetical protein